MKVNYVDENGLSLPDPGVVPENGSALTSGQIVDLNTWANDGSTSRISGYTFKEARIGDKTSKGLVITGLKAVGDTGAKTYQLFYTTDKTVDTANGSTNHWVQYTDKDSGSNANNANVYLVYTPSERLTVHYVDEKGNDINNSATDTKYAGDLGSETEVSGWQKSIENYKYKDAHLGSATGTVITHVKATQDGSTTTIQAKAGASGTYANVSSNDVYLVYDKQNYTARLNVHYVDIGGEPIKDAAGNPIVRILEGADYTSQIEMTSSTSASDFDIQFNGYYTFPGTTYNQLNENNTPSGIVLMPDANLEVKNGTKDAITVTSRNGISGHQFRWLQYTGGNLVYAYGTSNGTHTATANSDGSYDIYLMYVPLLTIHYVDSEGNQLYDDYVTTKQTQWGNSVANNNVTLSDYYNGHGTPVHIYDALPTVSEKNEITALKWGHTTASESTPAYWQTTETKSDNTTTTVSSLVKDVYMVYEPASTKTVTIHRIDSEGNKIAADVTKTLTGDTEYIPSTNTDNDFVVQYYDLKSGKYGMTVGTDGRATGGTAFYGFKYTNTDGSWSNSAKTKSSDYSPVDTTNELWFVYSKKADGVPVTVHYVDENGNNLIGNDGNPILPKTGNFTVSSGSFTNTWQGYTLRTNSNYSITVPAGYTFKAEYLGKSFDDNHKASDGSTNHVIQYYYDSTNGWYTSHTSGGATTTHNLTDAGVFNEYITDIYWVYTRTLTVHYVDTSGTKIADDTTLKLTGTEENPTALTDSTYAKTISGYAYVNTRTDSVSGPQVSEVRLKDGKIQYLTSTSYDLTQQGNNARWGSIASTGVTYTLYYENNNFRLYDNQNGSISLNYAGKTSSDTDAPDYYSATVKTDTGTMVYTVTPKAGITNPGGSGAESVGTYTLKVQEWTPSTNTEIYEIYTKSNEGGTIWIDDDLKYSGYFSVGMDDTVENNINNNTWTDVYYTWHRVTRAATWPTTTESLSSATQVDKYTTDNPVARKQTGRYWNLAYASGQRTWLDVSADEGARTKDTEAGYYVVMHYTQGGEEKSISSTVAPVEYYSQLENGGFEDVLVYEVTDENTPAKNGNNDIPNSKQGHQINGFNGNQTSNASYKTNGGVWQSTGVNSNGIAIEVFNIDEGNSGIGAVWNGAPTAAEGKQFAELNAETAGALYQDVVTIPGEALSYWFSHRARGNTASETAEYDTMYLVIMPTSQAMIAAKDGGELTDQSDLIDFINEHTNNGFNYAKPTEADYNETKGKANIICNDTDNGILIARVTSSDQAWNAIRNINGYIAKGNMTRFFFVAGPTAWTYGGAESGSRSAVEKATHGNLIDGVGYSQEADTGDGFNLTVTKTFSGLTNKEIADLADGGYKITISDKHVNTSTTPNTEDDPSDKNAGQPNSSLNGAVLSFEYTHTANSNVYVWKPTATLKTKNDLFTRANNDSSGSYTINDDGTVTLIWSFVAESITNGEIYNYTIDESGTAVSEKSLTVSENHSPESNINTNAAEVEKGTKARFNLTNSYTKITDSQQPELVVTKRFAGITPEVVDYFLGRGYKITVTKTQGEDGNNVSGVTTTLTADAENLDSNITLLKPETSDGSTTLKWIIRGTNWGPGTYTISETGYSSTAYPIQTIKVNNEEVKDNNQTPTDNAQKTGNEIGTDAKAAILTYSNDQTLTPTGTNTSLSQDTLSNLNTATNLIIAQYTGSNNSKNYIVWTSSAVGTNVAKTILKKINSDFSDITADYTKVKFISGENPGTITLVKDSPNTMTYDSSTGEIRFAKGESDTGNWTKMYSAQASGMDVADIAVVNSYEPEVRVQKVDSEDNTTPLKDVEFKLYSYRTAQGASEATKQYFKWDTSNRKATWESSKDSGDTFSTNEQGYTYNKTTGETALETISNLGVGTYYLEETKAHDGYNKLAAPIAFVIDNEGVVKAAEANDLHSGETADNSKLVKIDWESPYYTIIVSNDKGISLPITGSIGTTIFYVIGAGLIALAGIWLVLRRRRKL